jgi:hypothetical protein
LLHDLKKMTNDHYYIALDAGHRFAGLYDSADAAVRGEPPAHLLRVPVNGTVCHFTQCVTCTPPSPPPSPPPPPPPSTRAAFLRAHIGGFGAVGCEKVRPYDNHVRQFASAREDEDDGDVPILVPARPVTP